MNVEHEVEMLIEEIQRLGEKGCALSHLIIHVIERNFCQFPIKTYVVGVHYTCN